VNGYRSPLNPALKVGTKPRIMNEDINLIKYRAIAIALCTFWAACPACPERGFGSAPKWTPSPGNPHVSSSFIASIGINTHMGYYDTPYGNSDQIIKELSYLGISRVRDAAVQIGWEPQFHALGQAGIKLDLIIGSMASPLSTQIRVLRDLTPYVSSVEGPNEVNLGPVTFNGETGPVAARAEQKYIYDLVHSSPDLEGMSVIAFSVAGNIPADYTPYGYNDAFADYGNAHVYFGGGMAPEPQLAKYGHALNSALTPGEGTFLTETGYTTSPTGGGNQGVNEFVQAKYTLDVLLDAYKDGYVQTYLYELIDEFADPNDASQENHYGLFRNDGSAKPAAMALHDLTNILNANCSDAIPLMPDTLHYSVSGLPSTGSTYLLVKSNSTFDIMIWNEPPIWLNGSEIAAPTLPVKVDLGKTFDTVNVFDPMLRTTPVQTLEHVSTVQLWITDHPLIIEASQLVPSIKH